MATVSLTAQRGLRAEKDIVIGAGGAEAQSDTMTLNIDLTNLRRGEALKMIDYIKMRIHAAPSWPPA